MIETITREEIKEKYVTGKSMIIIEALPQNYYDTEHLPSALNIPHDEIKNLAPDLLPDKDAFIVVYCANSECKQHWLEAKFPVESTE